MRLNNKHNSNRYGMFLFYLIMQLVFKHICPTIFVFSIGYKYDVIVKGINQNREEGSETDYICSSLICFVMDLIQVIKMDFSLTMNVDTIVNMVI